MRYQCHTIEQLAICTELRLEYRLGATAGFAGGSHGCATAQPSIAGAFSPLIMRPTDEAEYVNKIESELLAFLPGPFDDATFMVRNVESSRGSLQRGHKSFPTSSKSLRL